VGGGRLDLLGPGDVLLGRPGCAGVGRGRARALASPRDAHRLRIGDVLVVSMFEPGWAPLLPGLSAVVADGGGPLSHATVVARELGVPCVVATGDATTVIPDGALVEVDGLAGVVSVGEVPDVTPAPADSTTDPWGSRAY
jgi:pyruvate,water dikinase